MMRVGARVAVAGEVFAAGRDARVLQRADDDRAEPRDVFRAIGQRAIADHRVLRVGVNVEHGRVVERDADGVELGRERRREARGEPIALGRPGAAQRDHRRPLGERPLQPRDTPAFLVDADPQRDLRRERLRLPRQIRDLLGRLDVAREEDDAAEIELARERSGLGRQIVSVESHDRQLSHVATQVPKRHRRLVYRIGLRSLSSVIGYRSSTIGNV